MNLIWKKIYENHRQSENVVLIYEAKSQEGNVRAILYVTPRMKDFDKGKRTVFSRIYFRTYAKEVSDYTFYVISNDIFELCDNQFGGNTIYKTMFNEYSIVSRFPSYKSFTFGDYTKSE